MMKTFLRKKFHTLSKHRFLENEKGGYTFRGKHRKYDKASNSMKSLLWKEHEQNFKGTGV